MDGVLLIPRGEPEGLHEVRGAPPTSSNPLHFGSPFRRVAIRRAERHTRRLKGDQFMPRKLLWAIRLSVLAAAVVLAPLALAGTTGKLSGRVVNEKKEPLPGVNVRIDGQRLGAITDDEGNYFIIGIPAGHYTVRMNLVGYAAYVAENVEVSPDFTTNQNGSMRTEAVQMTEVRVEATRPLLQKDATGTTRFLSSDDIQRLPTRGYRDAAAQQTGIVNFARNIDTEAQNTNTLIIRGGRPNETAYFVDGFSQQDPLTGTSSTSISNNAIEEVVVLTGGFNAEYGRIMSGAVNVVTREGADKYFGSVEAVTDNLSGSWIGTERTDYNIYDVSLGGPLWPGFSDANFYASAERRWQADRAPAFMTDVFKDQLDRFGLPAGRKPSNASGGFTFQGKVSWRLSEKLSVKLSGLGSEDSWQQYLNAYLFNQAHAPRYYDRNKSYGTTWSYVVSPKTFFNLSGNFFETLRKRGDGVAFDQLAKYYSPGGSNPTYDGEIPEFYSPGHIFDDYLQRNSSYYGVQGGFTSQVNQYHQVKAGADWQRHTLRYFDHFFPVQLGGTNPNLLDWDGYGYQMKVYRDAAGVVTRIALEDVDSGRDGAKHPQTWSTYVQDKFERSGVIVNGGLRFDHINVNTPALVSERFPLGVDDTTASLSSSRLDNADLQPNKTYARLSPRLGVAFPVDERTVLRFNYGQFYQQPNLQDLYVNYRFLDYKVRNGGYFVGFGNPNLRPERTTAYEVGLQRQLGDRVRLDGTAYYKDVKDLVEIAAIPSSPKSFSSYRNRDFATIKGFDLGLSMRPINHFSGQLSYSLSFAQGTGSVSNTQRNIAWVGTEVPKQTAPLDFDQRHKMSMNIDWRLGKGEGPIWRNMRMFENTGINALFNVASGTPYTPTKTYNEVTLAAVAPEPSAPVNSRYGPWSVSLDLKATRELVLGNLKVEAFVWGLNVLDNKNPIAVYTSTGSASTDNWLNTDDGQTFIANTTAKDGERKYMLAENNPNLYSNPRLVRFGLRTSF
jgi:outer membrane receptor protein involved in Fe transport